MELDYVGVLVGVFHTWGGNGVVRRGGGQTQVAGAHRGNAELVHAYRTQVHVVHPGVEHPENKLLESVVL